MIHPQHSSSRLLAPVRLGELTLENRVLMAPMTRNRADADGTPTELMARHYEQRAGAGLIIGEMTVVSAMGVAYMNAPGLHRGSHRAGWKLVTDRVHRAGGRIVAQIAHAGRISHPSLLPGEHLPVAPSSVRPAGRVYTAAGPQPFVTPRALEAAEIAAIVEEFAAAARMARDAGFDGVELHAANGYLLDQFLRDGTNRRNDQYGGSIPNRLRFLLKTVEAVAGAWAPGRVGVRFSPFSSFNDVMDSEPSATFAAAAEALAPFGLAYLHVVEPKSPDTNARLTPELRRRFRGHVIANGGFDLVSAEEAISTGEADAVSFGSLFIANPDLPERFATGAALATPDPSTFYTGGARGYIDYPVHRVAA